MANAMATRRLEPVNELGWEADSPQNGNGREAMVEVAIARSAQEVQAAMVIAKKFPRDYTASYNRILQACQRKRLAEQAIYTYPRGGESVEGPSIRLAEAIAQAWGNLDFGIVELEQRNGESTVMAYAWDLETNTRQTKIFTVKHLRYTRNGTKALSDPRDIYEMTANQGARRLRSCILGVIPGDVVEEAMAVCEKTMAGDSKEPLIDRVRKMLLAFEQVSVNQAMLEGRLGHRLDATTEAELSNLRKVFRSVKDGMATVESFFPSQRGEGTAIGDRLAEPKKAAPSVVAEPLPADDKPEPDASAGATLPPSDAEILDSALKAPWEDAKRVLIDAAVDKGGYTQAVAVKLIDAHVATVLGQKGKESNITLAQRKTLYHALCGSRVQSGGKIVEEG